MSLNEYDCGLGVNALDCMVEGAKRLAVEQSRVIRFESMEGYNSTAELIFLLDERRYKVTFEEVDYGEDS